MFCSLLMIPIICILLSLASPSIINITNIIAIKFILGEFMVVSSGKVLFIHQYE